MKKKDMLFLLCFGLYFGSIIGGFIGHFVTLIGEKNRIEKQLIIDFNKNILPEVIK